MDPASSTKAGAEAAPVANGPQGRSRIVFSLLMVLLALVFVALGTWQVQRLFWKLDLIERVETRVNATPAKAPAAAEWSGLDGTNAEYRHIKVTGRFLHADSVLVQAVTERGAGFWVVTPLTRTDGTIVLVNRGFVPADRRDRKARAASEIPGETTIVGLLRLSEPGGAFLRSNDPAADRWYSRDVQAIASARNLAKVAPFFVDADAAANTGGLPVGGLTVVKFRNSHLTYTLTWYALALMSAGAAVAIHRRRFV